MNNKYHQGDIEDLVVDALLVDGEHHKQWYLERILESLGVDVAYLQDVLAEQDIGWEPGIPP